MTDRVLIIGGTGRIGGSVARDIASHTPAEITIAGRSRAAESSARVEEDVASSVIAKKMRSLALDISNKKELREAIASHNLVVHCAGPFRYRDARVLEACIELGVNYIDVSDDSSFVRLALAQKKAAEAAGVTAIVSTGVFPGISNSMALQGVEQLDSADSIQISYVVSGSGGAGLTVMRTTFLELQHPFQAWIEGRWQEVQPYSQREIVEFPAPYHRAAVYWFNTVEAYTLPLLGVKTVTTKFGSVPDFYNYLTWMVARLPSKWLQNPNTIEFLSRASYSMTEVSDRFTGIGIAMTLEVSGEKNSQPARYVSTMVHENTAIAAGAGTGSVAEVLLSGEVKKPGVWPVELAMPTPLFQRTMQQRGIEIESSEF
ncbi:MAG: KR domain-containing protein [Oscillatoria sp. SIO1A7]|nr:KR domain-containing protein [Oscillatoria sp. SIO1A7]